jgi:ketosteroid isomerase-like protein
MTTTTEASNVEALKHAYGQWAATRAHSFDMWTAIVAPDITLTSLAEGAKDLEFTKPAKGREAFVDYLKGLTDNWDMLSYTIREYIATGDRVIAVGSTSWKNKKTGHIFDTRKIDLWRMHNGKAVEFEEFYDTAKVLAAAQA